MTVLLFIQNISPFLIGLNLTYNSWLAAILDQILKKFMRYVKNGVNRVAKLSDYWTVKREDLRTRLSFSGSDYKMAEHKLADKHALSKMNSTSVEVWSMF